MDIENLVKQAQAGDSCAAEILYERFMPLLRAASAQTHIRCIYEDAFATASLSLLEAIHSYKKEMLVPFAGYAKAKIFGDLRTLFKRERRNWQRELSVNCAPSEPSDLLSAFSTSSFEKQSIDKLAIATALKELSFQQQEVILHRFSLGYTQAETAKRLKLSQQAIASKQKRSMKLLRQILIDP